MPLQTSGPISIANLRGEFGGAAPDGMSEYRAGGGRVPSGCSGLTGAIPSTLSNLNLGRYYGACVATAPPSITRRITVGRGPPHSGIHTSTLYPTGYSAACYNGDTGLVAGNGSTSGALSLSSVTFWTVAYMFAANSVLLSSGGFLINMYPATTKRFVLDVDYRSSAGVQKITQSFDTHGDNLLYRQNVSGVTYGGTCVGSYTVTQALWGWWGYGMNDANAPYAPGDYFDLTITEIV